MKSKSKTKSRKTVPYTPSESRERVGKLLEDFNEKAAVIMDSDRDRREEREGLLERIKCELSLVSDYRKTRDTVFQWLNHTYDYQAYLALQKRVRDKFQEYEDGMRELGYRPSFLRRFYNRVKGWLV